MNARDILQRCTASMRRRERFALAAAAFAWLAAGLVTACLSPSVAAEEAPLTADEQAALARDELVTRRVHVRRGDLNLIGGLSWQVIDAPSHLVWRALQDVSHYSNMLPAVVEARELSARDSVREVYVRHSRWPFQASYVALIESDPEALVLSFRLNTDRPHDLRAGWGFVRLVPRETKTLLAFGILADVGAGVLGTVAQSLIQPWMLRTPRQIKRFLERGGRRHYER